MTRYTITLHGTVGAKARLRTALKLMGFDAIRIEEAEAEAIVPKTKPDNVPTSAVAKAVADLYRRDHTTAWSEKEIAAFRKARATTMLTRENMEIIATHYKAERRKEEHFCRRDLLTFLNNFGGELDRARAAKPTAGRRLEWTPANVVAMPVPDEAEAQRIRDAAKAQAEAFRREARP